MCTSLDERRLPEPFECLECFIDIEIRFFYPLRHLNQPIQINRKSKLYNFKWLLFAIGLHNVCTGDCGILTLFRIIAATAPINLLPTESNSTEALCSAQRSENPPISHSIQKLKVQLNWSHGACKTFAQRMSYDELSSPNNDSIIGRIEIWMKSRFLYIDVCEHNG